MTMEQRIQRQGNASKMATEISAVTMEVLSESCADQRNIFHQVITDANIRGIASRIARATLFRMTNQKTPLITRDPEKSDFQIIDEIEAHVREEFGAWWTHHQDYVASRDMQQEKTYIDANGAPEEDSDIAVVLGIIENNNFSINPELRKIYDDVRGATYGTINGDNIEEILPQIERSYKTSWLEGESLWGISRNNPQQLEKFNERTKRGVFVFGFRERVDGKPSVAEQMHADFKRSPEEGPLYKGKYLRGADGKLLAWLTYWQPEIGLHNGHEQMVTDYLEQGVTGKPMTYTRTPKKEEHVSHAKHTLMFDTIWAGKRFAARRLFPKALIDMWKDNRSLKRFLGYRLNGIETFPSYRELHEHPRIGENWYSARFFLERRCATFAHDFNEFGPQSTRVLPDGTQIRINPEWAAFYGEFPEVLKTSWELWRQTQAEFGDLSSDGYDRMVINYKPPVIS